MHSPSFLPVGTRRQALQTAAILCLASLPVMALAQTAASPTTVAGIKLEEALDVAGSRLLLNGAGIRYKAIFQVYVAALYTTRKISTLEEAYSVPGPRRVAMTMLREVDSNDFGKSFTKAFEENTPKGEMSKLIPGLIMQGDIFARQKKLGPGDTIWVDWIPDRGTVISVKGVSQGEPSKEVEFYNAMLRIWLGPKPVDSKLKEAMLGQAAK